MEEKQYRVMEISEGQDSHFDKVWIIKANPVETNPLSGASFVMSDLYEGTETFILPYDNEIVDEVEEIAKANKLWTPQSDEWKTESAFDEKARQRKTIHRFNEQDSSEGIIQSGRKPLKQFLLEQRKDIFIVKRVETETLYFECGEIKGIVSPAASSRITNFNCPIDDFYFAMVSRQGEKAIPCICLAKDSIGNNKEKLENTYFLNRYAQIYHALLKNIKTNYVIETPGDFELFDASFLLDTLALLHLPKDKTLGLYRRQDDIVDRSFFASPYVHNANADKLFEPIITPIKKTFLQRIGMAGEPNDKEEVNISEFYAPTYLIQGVIDRRIACMIPRPSFHFTLDNRNPEAVWEMFLLDHIEYFLPKFDHGVYKERKIICKEMIEDLPFEVRRGALSLEKELNPDVFMCDDLAIIRCCYFNMWKGIVRWRVQYHLESGKIEYVKNSDEYKVLVKYDCGMRI